MTYQTIRTELDARGVMSLVLNRLEQRNAISPEMMDELTDFAGRAAGEGTRAVVLSGEGGVFCAGGDLKWMMSQIETDRATRMAEAKRLALMLKALNEMPVPLIARVEGVAMGGALGLLSVADVALVARNCRMGFTETRLGIIPATISPYVIARMGEGRARRVFMSARIFDGEEAVTLGLAAAAVEPEDLPSAVEAEVAPFLIVPSEAVGRAKRLARSLGPRIDDEVIDATIHQLADAWETESAREGIAAFLEKRKPIWDQSS